MQINLHKFIILILCLFSFQALTAKAAGISVSPAKLNFVVEIEKPASLTLTVVNPTADVQVFEVYPDDFKDLISISPESFTLESGGQKIVTITVNSKKINGQISTNISIVSKPLAESKLQFATGAKIPLTAESKKIAESKNKPLVLAGIVAIALLTAGYYLGQKQKH